MRAVLAAHRNDERLLDLDPDIDLVEALGLGSLELAELISALEDACDLEADLDAADEFTPTARGIALLFNGAVPC